MGDKNLFLTQKKKS